MTIGRSRRILAAFAVFAAGELWGHDCRGFRFGHWRELGRVRGSLLSLALRSIVAGIAVLAVALAFIPGGMPTPSSGPGSRSERLTGSVFGMMYSVIDKDRVPVNSRVPGVRLASLETDFTS